MNTTFTLHQSKREEILDWAERVIRELIASREMYDGYDAFFAFNELLDVNIHTNGHEKGVIRVVAHTVKPVVTEHVTLWETNGSNFVVVGEFRMNGDRIRR